MSRSPPRKEYSRILFTWIHATQENFPGKRTCCYRPATYTCINLGRSEKNALDRNSLVVAPPGRAISLWNGGSAPAFFTRQRKYVQSSYDILLKMRKLLSIPQPANRQVDSAVELDTKSCKGTQLERIAKMCSAYYWEQNTEYRFTVLSDWRRGEERINPQAFLNKAPWDLPNRHGEEFWLAHKSILDSRLPFHEFAYHYFDGGRRFWISSSGEPMFAPNGAFLGYCGCSRDITKEKDVEYALRKSHKGFKEIADLMPVSVFVKDAASRILFLNTECEKAWGLRRDEVLGTDVSDHFPPEHVRKFLASDRMAYEEKRVIDFEETIWNASLQAYRNVHTYKKPIFDKAGQPRYLIGVRVDITDKKSAEVQLRASEQSIRELALHQASLLEDERRRIARDIHDELGQNLLAIRIEASRLVQRSGTRHPRLHQYASGTLRTIDDTIRNVRDIINNLRPAVLDLGLPDALQWLVREFAKHSGLACSFESDIDGAELVVKTECSLVLFRVAQEALTNVQKHSNATAAHLSLMKDDHHLMLIVKDNGAGLPKEIHQPNKFGIIGMRERVKTLGGTLDIESGAQGGALLVAKLPLSAVQAMGH